MTSRSSSRTGDAASGHFGDAASGHFGDTASGHPGDSASDHPSDGASRHPGGGASGHLRDGASGRSGDAAAGRPAERPNGRAVPAPLSLVLVEPADLPGPSGGLIFNASLVRALREAGHAVEVRRVPGAWPRPGAGDRLALDRALRRDVGGRPVVVDGIVASAAPAQVRAAGEEGGRVVVLVHLPLPAETGLPAEERDRLAAGEHEALAAAGRVLCTSAWAARDLAERYGIREPGVVEPGVDDAAPARGSTPPRILLLGSLTPRKNPLAVLRALGRLTDLPWTASLTGPFDESSPYARQVLDAARALGAGRAEVTGPLTGRPLDEAWDRADLLVLASTAETYGMVVAEAHARGIPTLVGAGTAAEDVLRGAGPPPGAAVDPADEAAIAAALRRWLADSRLRLAWREAALQRRGSLRPWKQTAETLVTHLNRS